MQAVGAGHRPVLWRAWRSQQSAQAVQRLKIGGWGDAPLMSTAATSASPVVRGSPRPAIGRDELEQFFEQISTRLERSESGRASDSSSALVKQSDLQRFFAAVSRRTERAETEQRRRDKRQATGFNVFDLIEPDENKLSDILADLLDHKGSHGQGDVFLLLFFQRLGLAPDTKLTKDATVHREAPTHGIQKYRRRMDVLVEAEVLLAIENKVDSSEQLNQVKDYLEHLRCCSHASRKRGILIYLTPDGRRPEFLEEAAFAGAKADGSLRCWSYQVELRAWLEACGRDCKSEKIRHFLGDFIAYISTAMKRETDNNQEKGADEN